MVLGGLAVVFYGGHAPLASLHRVFRKVDLQSMFFALIFVIIILVLAYLTNPTENSFRTYLTERSFRQHLSRLDDSNHDDHSDSEDSGVHFNISRTVKPLSSPPFHFANRAAVSLRTPKHVFYSFGIMTIAAVLPSGASNRSNNNKKLLAHQQGRGFLVSESWFIGAFGKWWRGGPIQSWWIDSMANAKDAERCNSGVLDMKALDNVNLECFDGLPSALSTHIPLASRESPSKSRGTERSLQRSTNNAPRSTTPPPLPKSASLPLHAPRIPSCTPSSKSDKANGQRQTQPLPHPPATPLPEPAKLQQQPQIHPSASAIFDNSPVISDLLRQISTSNNSIYDIRTQLTDFRKQAADSHAAIQRDLEAQRERKRTEDAARAELKGRTKTLEDSKRTAEASKREAEKRLRAAENARDNASQRIERLDKEIGALVVRMSEDEQAALGCKEEGDRTEEAVAAELEHKRREIKVAEDVVAALNLRAKELEERIAGEEERLKRAKEQAELRKQDRAFYPLHIVHPQEPADTAVWSPIMSSPTSVAPPLDPHAQINSDRSEQIEVFPPNLQIPHRDRGSSLSEESRFSTSPRPRHLSLGGISNLSEYAVHNGVPEGNAGFAPPGQVHMRAIFQDDLPSLSSGRTQSTRFSPFADNELEIPVFENGSGVGISPRSSSLIPTSLIKSLEGGAGDDICRSFQSENDAVLDRDWRKTHPFPVHPVESPGVFSSSPTSLTCPSFDGVDKEDPFEIRPPPLPIRHRITSDGADSARSFLGGSLRTTSDPQPLVRSRTHESDEGEKTASHRRWFSSNKDTKEKKGLNPEAKVFQFKKTFPAFPTFSMHRHAGAAHFDGLGAAAMASSLSVPAILAPSPSDSDSVFSTVSMRAFAPSPEEREALSRALGSSTNTSLDRLPTLSDVAIGSMPSSPSHAHALAAASQPSPPHVLAQPANRSLLSPGFAWLQSLPRMRKPKFSPWDDESGADASAVASTSANAHANDAAEGH